jgi:hypothetical protein
MDGRNTTRIFLGLFFSFLPILAGIFLIDIPKKYSYYQLVLCVSPVLLLFIQGIDNKDLHWVVIITIACMYSVNFYSYSLNLLSIKESFIHMLIISSSYFIFMFLLGGNNFRLIFYSVYNIPIASLIYAWKFYKLKKIQFN